MAITSKSCSGTCLIFSSARQPKAAVAASGLAGAGRGPAGRLLSGVAPCYLSATCGSQNV
jgi:hypothetical protein